MEARAWYPDLPRVSWARARPIFLASDSCCCFLEAIRFRASYRGPRGLGEGHCIRCLTRDRSTLITTLSCNASPSTKGFTRSNYLQLSWILGTARGSRTVRIIVIHQSDGSRIFPRTDLASSLPIVTKHYSDLDSLPIKGLVLLTLSRYAGEFRVISDRSVV